jgi:hypothetical protein
MDCSLLVAQKVLERRLLGGRRRFPGSELAPTSGISQFCAGRSVRGLTDNAAGGRPRRSGLGSDADDFRQWIDVLDESGLHDDAAADDERLKLIR